MKITRHRQSRYPKTIPVAVFLEILRMKKSIYYGKAKKCDLFAYYLDKIGVKGCLNVGNVWVSSQHANMLINKGNGTTADIIALARILQQKYLNLWNHPQPEMYFVGFKEYPLFNYSLCS